MNLFEDICVLVASTFKSTNVHMERTSECIITSEDDIMISVNKEDILDEEIILIGVSITTPRFLAAKKSFAEKFLSAGNVSIYHEQLFKIAIPISLKDSHKGQIPHAKTVILDYIKRIKKEYEDSLPVKWRSD